MRKRALKHFWRILCGAAFEWNQDKAPRMAAAIAFYTVFSLIPIVIIAVTVAGLFFNEGVAQSEILEQARFLVGKEGASAIEMLLRNKPDYEPSLWATLFGLATTIFVATGAFTELKDSLNTIWEVKPKPGIGLLEMVRDRLLSFAMVLVIGFLLLVSLVSSAALSALARSVSNYVPENLQFMQAGNFLISFAVITILFALIYRILPDADVAWHDVWIGAGFIAILFVIGKSLFGLYLGHSTVGTQFGAAGSLVIVVLWTYYSCLILLFGAEMTQVQSRLRGVKIHPTEKAVHLTEHDRIQQGAPHQEEVARSLEDANESALARATRVSRNVNRRVFWLLIAGATGFLLGWIVATTWNG